MTPTQTSHPRVHLLVCLTLVAAIIVGAIAPGALAAIVVPANPTTAFIQTTGPNAALNIGDYRTNIAGDNLPHEIEVSVACTPGQTYAFQIFDPAIDIAGNPPGVGLDGVTDRVQDEQRGAADNTTHQLISPNGTQVAIANYAPGTSDMAWTTLYSVTTTGTPNVDCGSYVLRSSTTGDDDNAWRFRLWGGNPALPTETFDPLHGPDGVPGTGDESWLGILAVSYQHEPTGGASGCQNFYWFVPATATNLYMLTFDLDNATSVNYQTPGGTSILGTLSGFTVWNDTPPQLQARPVYTDMSTFDVTIGDVTGDATAIPEPGLWQATVCVPIQNQYSFEVPGYQLYLDPPVLPTVTIAKDDGVTTVNSPGTTTYTLVISNTTQAAAMPIPGPEVVDTLPAGMSFVSCAVNAPLVGTCAGSPGSPFINFELQAQTATTTTLAYLPGIDVAPNNVGTLTVVANVAPGLSAGTLLTNTATVDFTDIRGNDYPPVSASDTDTVVGAVLDADMSIVKADQPDPVVAGQTLTYTLLVANAGPADAQNVTVADTLPAGLTFVSATPPQASGPNPLIWNLGTFAVGSSRTITVVSTVAPGLTGVITNTATVTSTTPDPNLTNNRDDEPTTIVTSAADVSVVKTDQPDPVNAGEILTYTLLVANAGPSDAQNVVVNDTLPAQVTFVSANPTQASGPNPLTWNLGTLAVGGSTTLTIVTRVVSGTAGVITNTATVTTTTPDTNLTNNRDDEPTGVPTAVELLYFRVNGVSGQTVRLAWATAEEIDNFGFNLYRAPANDFSRAALIHFEPSAIKGGGAGATYGYSDTPPQEGVWWYWLADLDTQGRETVHAPVSAAVGPNALPHRAYLPLVQK